MFGYQNLQGASILKTYSPFSPEFFCGTTGYDHKYFEIWGLLKFSLYLRLFFSNVHNHVHMRTFIFLQRLVLNFLIVFFRHFFVKAWIPNWVTKWIPISFLRFIVWHTRVIFSLKYMVSLIVNYTNKVYVSRVSLYNLQLLLLFLHWCCTDFWIDTWYATPPVFWNLHNI